MALGFAFVTLDDEQEQRRRQLLDHYALIAQISFLAVLVLIRVYFFLSWLGRKWSSGDEETRPSSPYIKHERLESSSSLIVRVRKSWGQWQWWCGEPMIRGWGTKGQWLVGGVWMLWLFFLCYLQTAPDYLHLTKRFAMIGASQLPFHYLLAMKSPYSPIQLITRMSHEELNIGHQILGRIIQTLLTLHAAFYLSFYILNNLLGKRIQDRDVIIGLTGIILFTTTATTALGFLRKLNYRVFYITHITIATIFLPLMYFHVIYIRPFIWEAAGVYVLHIALRLLNTRHYTGSISLIPGTNLIQVTVPLATSTAKWKPGQHVYLSLPRWRGSRKYGLHRLRTNPFTVASLPRHDGQLLLIARALNGNTKRLASLARSAAISDGVTENKSETTPLILEGPYGASGRLPDFSLFDHVLLVAGGVGGTFIVPVWRHIHSQPTDYLSKAGEVRFVWAVRKVVETSWAFPEERNDEQSSLEGVEVYITGPRAGESIANGGMASGVRESIEMAERDKLMEEEDDKALIRRGISVRYSRPVLREVVDEAFAGHAERVAVLVCGPASMGHSLRKEVGRWARRGKDVYWHAEIFGF